MVHALHLCGPVVGGGYAHSLCPSVLCVFTSVQSGKYRYFQSFTEGRSGQRKSHVGEAGLTLRGSALPDHVDWVEAGAVTAGPFPSLTFSPSFTLIFLPPSLPFHSQFDCHRPHFHARFNPHFYRSCHPHIRRVPFSQIW